MMKPISDETRALVQRLAEAVREVEAWAVNGGARWWLPGWIADMRYLLDRVEQQDREEQREDQI